VFWLLCSTTLTFIILASQIHSFRVDAHFKQWLVRLTMHWSVTQFVSQDIEKILLSWERRYHCTDVLFFSSLSLMSGRNRFLLAETQHWFSGAHVRLINDSMLLSSKAFQWHTQCCCARWEPALCLAASHTWWADFNNSVYVPLCFLFHR